MKAKLAAVLAYEVEYQAGGLAIGFAQAAAELLKKQDGAFRGTEEEERLYVGNVDAFIE